MSRKHDYIYVSVVPIIIIIASLLASSCFLNRMIAPEDPERAEIGTTMTKEERFAEVFQRAIEVAERRLYTYDPSEDPLRKSDLEDIVKILRRQKQEVLSKGVEVYDGVYGPIKHVIDLGEPDGELMQAVYQIEVFYRENYIAFM